MTIRQRHPIPTSSPNPTHSQTSIPDSPKKATTALPWYQYPLNLILSRTLRFLGKFGFWIHNRQYHPNGIKVTRRMGVKMRDGKEVVLHIYEPLPSSNTTHTSNPGLRPCVINFHGGGFTIGSGTDDSRWAHWVTRTTPSSSSSFSFNHSLTPHCHALCRDMNNLNPAEAAHMNKVSPLHPLCHIVWFLCRY